MPMKFRKIELDLEDSQNSQAAMSIYRKIVGVSSASASSSPTTMAKSLGHLNQLDMELERASCLKRHNNNNHNNKHLVTRQKSCASRVPVVRMSPILSSLSSTLSSTPISSVARNNYKRLMPAEEFKHGHEQQHQVPISAHNHHQLATHSFSSTPQQLNQMSPPNYHHQQQQQQQIHHQQQQIRLQQQMTASCYSLNQSRRPQAQTHYSSNSIDLSQRQVRRAIFVSPIAPPPKNSSRATRGNKLASRGDQSPESQTLESVFRTNDPVLLEWMRAMRFDAELECLTALQARTLAIDDNLAAALGVRNSQVAIQELRLESDYVLDLTDILIDMLPLNFGSLDKFALDFSHLWGLLVRQTEAQTRSSNSTTNPSSISANTINHCQNNLTIINCTPRKSLASARTLRPLDELANKIRATCIELANTINSHQEQHSLLNLDSNHQDQMLDVKPIDNGHLEAGLRRIKELFGKFVEISVRAECANIVRALQFDFSAPALSVRPLGTSKLENATNLQGGGGSSASLKPVRVYQASTAQLPLKWALIALWQLTKDDGYICRLLTEMWQTGGGSSSELDRAESEQPAFRKSGSAVKRLDYSTQSDVIDAKPLQQQQQNAVKSNQGGPRRCEKPLEICERFRENQQAALLMNQQAAASTSRAGALSSAMRSKQQATRQLSTIELLIGIIISQPNKHERVDMMNFMQHSRLVDLESGGNYQHDQDADEDENERASAALYTSNQYKVAALRILNHLCINEQAIKTILKCFSTAPPRPGQPLPQNKIIKSIFECYQTAQEHIYQNETMFSQARQRSTRRKRARHLSSHATHNQHHQQQADYIANEEFSDYGSRQTSSVPTSSSLRSELVGGGCGASTRINNQDFIEQLDEDEEGDDAVVKEALRLLVQLTTPFHRSNQGHDFYTLIGRFSVESLVKYLSNIIKSTGNRDMVLLALSALANISFISTEPMKMVGTSTVILDMFRNSKTRSKDLELRDQTVTILANMADKNAHEMATNGALAFLLSCLEVCPTRMANFRLVAEQLPGCHLPQMTMSNQNHQYARIGGSDSSAEAHGGSLNSQQQRKQFGTGNNNIENKPRDRKPIQVSDEFFADLDCVCDSDQRAQLQTNMPLLCLARLQPNQLAAMERIHQKAAVAFARLSADLATSRLVLKYGGIKQMIDLCKLSNRRNHSDTVLIACLAALRKMAQALGHEVFRHYNALDLIELELSQALEIYGSLYASEV